jgi:hypothetical protein
MDISSIASKSFVGAKFWLMVQDEFTGYIWSHFLQQKSDLATTMISWIQNLYKTTQVKIKTIKCDNAGENITLQKRLIDEKDLNIKFEFTAPYTPEMNGKIERKFATLYGKTRSILNSARLPSWLRHGLWAQCAKHATDLENILCFQNETKTAMEKFYGVLPKWIKNMKPFGEIGVISDEKNKHIRSKLSDRGFPAIFIGYPKDHAADVFEFFNYKTKAKILSRSVTWMNKNYAEYHNLFNVHTIKLNDEESDDDDHQEEEKDVNGKENDEEIGEEINNEDNEDQEIVQVIP